MKKLILMTSALTLVGGSAFAAAHGGEIDITAEVGVSFGTWEYVEDNNGASPSTVNSEAASFDTSATLALEGSSGGLTYGGELTVEASDDPADHVDLGLIYFSGGFGKFEFLEDEWDTTDDELGDARYTNAMNGFDVELILNLAGMGSEAGQGRLGLGFDGGNFTAGVVYDTDETYEVSADFTTGGVTVGGSYADDTGNSSGALEDTEYSIFASTTVGGVDVKATYTMEMDEDPLNPGSTIDTDSYEVEASGSAAGVDWSVLSDDQGEGEASLSTSFGDTTVAFTYVHDGGAVTSSGRYNGEDTGEDARAVLSVEQAIGNVTLGVKANDAEEYEVSATATFAM